MSMRAKKSEAASRTWISTRSGMNSFEYIKLLFCSEKIIFSKKLSKSY